MKKTFLLLGLALAFVAVSCQKEDDIKPVYGDTTPVVDPTDPVDTTVSLIGTWIPTNLTKYAIYFYSKEDGSLIDSTISELGNDGFTFYENGTVATPFGYSGNYQLANHKLDITLMGVYTLSYDMLSLQQNHMAFERRDTSDYLTSMNGDGDTVTGITIEHWDLTRSAK